VIAHERGGASAYHLATLRRLGWNRLDRRGDSKVRVSQLFSPLTLRGTTLRNRVFVSPMCQYSSVDGHPGDWHLVHLGSFARGGAGLVMTEATAVTADGRISPQDAGIWTDGQADDYQRITRFIRQQGAKPGIQLAHAGRKASTVRPWDRVAGSSNHIDAEAGGWQAVAPSPLGYDDWPTPSELTVAGIADIVAAFAAAAVRADGAGFEFAEIHSAHGYLLHEFLSPLSNERLDSYGGDFTGRIRALLEVIDAVRRVWPDRKPLSVRVSATDWVDGGWDLEQTEALSHELVEHGVDVIDVSSGGNSPKQQIPVGPGYQVPHARAVREASGLPTIAVGMITSPQQAEQIVSDGSADAVMLARQLLREPHWPLRAAYELRGDVTWPQQYTRAMYRRHT
jgi:2,4-dienoyl-CoA reductase-like NADH-dependent reductase (Old Yellow Enzyme family)